MDALGKKVFTCWSEGCLWPFYRWSEGCFLYSGNFLVFLDLIPSGVISWNKAAMFFCFAICDPFSNPKTINAVAQASASKAVGARTFTAIR